MSLTWYTIKTLTFRLKYTYVLLSVAALQSKTDTNRSYDERFLQIHTLYLYSYLYWYIIAFACSIKRFVIVCLFFFSFSFSSVLLQRLPRVFLRTFYHSLTSKCVTKIGLISLFTLKKVSARIVAKVAVRGTCGTWHTMCFTENNNGRSRRAYTVTDILHLR